MTSRTSQLPPSSDADCVPIVEERVRVSKETVETGSVHLSSSVATNRRLVVETLASVQVTVERHPVNLLVEDAPAVRT